MSRLLVLPVAAACSFLTACADAPPTVPVKVPAALAVPAGSGQYLELLATGVQIYVCAKKADASYEWVFKAPEATLTSRSGAPAGKHYAGPTWEAPDGSAVVGEVRARDPGPTASAIPWLLLAAKSNRGQGVFASTKYVQRLETVAGLAPVGACGDANLNAEARVPYTATYTFFR
jgi:hypothetical protein